MATPAAVLTIMVEAQTGRATTQLRKLNAELAASEGQANRTTKSTSKFAGAAKTAGIAAGALAAYGLYKAVAVGAKFEKQMDSLGAVTQATGKEMAKLEKQALKLGESTQYTANQVAEAQTELAKGGLTVKQIYGGALKAALSLAAAGELELAQAAETTVNAMKLFGLHGKDASQIADMLATAANRTTADVSDFAMALKQGGSVAKLAGLNFNNTVTILEALAEAGIKNSDAGTSLKTSLVQLLKPSEKQAKLAKELGLNFETQAGTMKSGVGLSKELIRVTDGLTKTERAHIFATLAGTDGVRTLNALYEAGPAKLKKLEAANQKQGTAQKIAAEKMNNLTGDTEQFTGAAETLGIKISKVLNPALRQAFQAMTPLLQKLSRADFSKIQHELGLTNDDMRALGKAAKFLSEVWSKYFGVVTARASEALKAVGIILHSFIGIVRGIVKVISGVLTGDFGKAWDGVEEIFRSGVNSVIGFLNILIGALNDIPGLPNIGKIGLIGGSSGPQHSLGADKGEGRKGSTALHHQHRQRGGPIWGGDASGDSIPAMLERGEYVLNRNAVRSIGKKQLDAINFAAAPRFSVGSFIGSAAHAATEPFGVAKKALNVAGKGAGFFLGNLPTPHLPQPFSGLGPYVISQVTDFIKNGFGSGKLGSSGPGATSGPSGTAMFDGKPVARWIIPELMWARKHGWKGVVTSGWRDPNEVVQGTFATAPQGQSEHQYTQYPGGAVDLSAYEQFAQIIAAYKGPRKLIQLGIDPLHFSGTGHRLGGFIARFRKGGQAGGLPAWAHGSGSLNADQLATLAHAVGAPNPGLMSQIAQAESGGNPHSMGGAGDKGLWQIIPSTAAAFGINYGSLFDPLANAKGMKRIVEGQGLGAWSTYNSGAYRGYPKGKVSRLVGSGRRSGSAASSPSKSFTPHAALGKAQAIQGLSGNKVLTVGGLKGSTLPSAAGLSPAIQSLLNTPGLSYQGREQIASLAMEQAQRTEGGADDIAVRAFEMELFGGRKTALEKKVAAINARLQKRGLTPKQQAKLLGKRESILGELTSVSGQIGGVEAEGVAEAEEKQREATEALTAAIEAHDADIKAMTEELKHQTEFAQSATASSSAVAWRALSDILSGQLGPKTYQRSLTAGAGSVGTF